MLGLAGNMRLDADLIAEGEEMIAESFVNEAALVDRFCRPGPIGPGLHVAIDAAERP